MSETNNHHKFKKKIYRSVAIASTVAGAVLGPLLIANNSEAKTPTPPQSTEDTNFSSTSLEISGVTINSNSQGMPVSYELYDKTYQFSSDQIDKMKILAKKAKENNTPELLVNIDGKYVGFEGESWQTSPDRPVVFDVPADVLSENDLQKYGVTEIIQGQETNLFIRKVAFEKGGILYELLQAQSLANPVKLRVVLVDGPTVSQDYMQDPKYDDVRVLAYARTDGPDSFRKNEISKLEVSLVNATNELHKAQQNKDKNKETETLYQIYNIKTQINDYENASIQELMQKINSNANHAVGTYIAPEGINDKGEQIATVLLAVGNSLSVREKIKIFIGPEGKLYFTNSWGVTQDFFDYRANSSKSFPHPQDFDFNADASPQNNGYPYGAQNNQSGENLTHELMHLRKITLLPLLTGATSDYSEYNTDMEAFTQKEKEYRTWMKQGNDLSKNPYPFVFKTGGIIQITKNENLG